MTYCAAPFTDVLSATPPVGMLTSVLRSSLDDGPGIRTTVFFKGCPLRCLWCHNPETQSFAAEVEFRSQTCQHCGACSRVCGLEPRGDGGFDRNICVDQSLAAGACPSGALTTTGRMWRIDEVMAGVLKDAPFYTASGGGLTLSGGEPLQQAEFAVALLLEARRHKLHTCVETAGHVPAESFLAILPLVDLMLFDWKATNPEQHRLFTGVNNRLIRTNLEVAVGHTVVRLRCPLVPGINDTDEHLEGIVELTRSLPDIKAIEVMPYHTAGVAKYERYGRPNSLPGVKAPSQENIQRWIEKLGSARCTVTLPIT